MTQYHPPASIRTFLPRSWLGMIGGGQLGRMFCHAAQRLGYRVMVLDPAQECPAGAVADAHLCAAYDDEQALEQLARRCAAISIEFENVPARSLEQLQLAEKRRVSPSAAALSITQDRILEKAAVQRAGFAVVDYVAVHTADDIANAPASLFPGILKTARQGYDGKGQIRVATHAEAQRAWQTFNGQACVLEALVPLDREISVIVARGFDGTMSKFGPMTNTHRDGILVMSAMEPVTGKIYGSVTDTARALAQALDYHGVMCVEFFVLKNGRVLVNEIAPRPHNSGHCSIDACSISQFDLQVRVLAGLPLGTGMSRGNASMLNLLGDLWFDAWGKVRNPDWTKVLTLPDVYLHLYGKADARPGRKMGHITVIGKNPEETAARVAQVKAALGMA